jgi:hypothetical protein
MVYTRFAKVYNGLCFAPYICVHEVRDEVLNYKVKVTAGHFGDTPGKIEDILNNID